MSFIRTVVLPVPPDEAFALLTEPERLRRWQTVTAFVDLRAGGAYRWTVTPGHIAAGTYREIEPGKRIVFGWGWESSPDLPPDASTVTLTVEPSDEGGTLVTLVHEGLDETQATAHAVGWTHYLDRLVLLARTGDAGPDRWGDTTQTLTPIVAAQGALAAVQPILRGLTDADRPQQTPCADFTCHDLVVHLMDSLVRLAAMAGATLAVPESGSLESRISELAGQVIDAWYRVDLDGTVSGPGGGPMPARIMAGVLPIELAVHGWDLAQASAQPMPVPDLLVGYLRELAEDVVPGGRGTSFADEVEADPAASPMDRLAAFTGRRPLAA